MHFFDLKPTHNSHRWFLHATRDVSAGPPDRLFLFGGIGLGASIAALERTLDRPVTWATAQYVSFAPIGSIVDFDVHEVHAGRAVTQARVIAHIHDKAILLVSAALGSREGPSDQWQMMPDVPSPDSCPEVHHWRDHHARIDSRFEKRLIEGRFPDGQQISGRAADGRLRLWIRPKVETPITADLLAVIADFVVEATSHSLGCYAGGNSLDNTIRFGRIEQSEWLLCEISIDLVHQGFTHGTMKIFGQSGTLMAIASQTLMLRIHASNGLPPP